MKILLRQDTSGAYYSASGTWVRAAGEAQDFRWIENAVCAAERGRLERTTVVLQSEGQPAYEVYVAAHRYTPGQFVLPPRAARRQEGLWGRLCRLSGYLWHRTSQMRTR